jgi:hypothetical protein
VAGVLSSADTSPRAREFISQGLGVLRSGDLDRVAVLGRAIGTNVPQHHGRMGEEPLVDAVVSLPRLLRVYFAEPGGAELVRC